MEKQKPPIYLKFWFIFALGAVGFFGVLLADLFLLLWFAHLVLLGMRIYWSFKNSNKSKIRNFLSSFSIKCKSILGDIVPQISKQRVSTATNLDNKVPTVQDSPYISKSAVNHPIEKTFSAQSSLLSVSSTKHSEECRVFNEEVLSLDHVEIPLSPSASIRRELTGMPQIKISNITRRTVIENIFPFVVVDIETTGFSPTKDSIVEFSAIRYEYPFEPVCCFSTLVKPRGVIPKKATAVHGITDDMVADAPSFSQVMQGISSFISGCNIVGHNVKFDLNFLYANGVDLSFDVRYYDTMYLAKYLLRKEGSRQYDHHAGEYYYLPADEADVSNYKLDTICNYYGIYRNTSHRSLSDCLATGKIFRLLIEDKTA